MAKEWLSLSEVAKMLGVHPSTVRNWADLGRLPVRRTEGGHRRFRRADVELWNQSQMVQAPREADLVIQSALGRTRFQISEGGLEQEGWFKKLDKRARDNYRKGGRALLQGMMGYLTTDSEVASAEARAIGSDYASTGRRCGLSRLEATQAFMFFRNMLVESMISVYETAAIQSPYAWSTMLKKINAFTDQVLLALLEHYQVYQND